MGDIYRIALPGLAGRGKRDLFNGMARPMVAACGLVGAALGLGQLGPPGAILGLACGLAAGARLAVKGRFHRP